MRLAGGARRARAAAAPSLGAGLEAAAYACVGAGFAWVFSMLPVARWQGLAFAAVLGGVTCGVIRGRAACRGFAELKQLAEAARSGPEGDWSGLLASITCSDLREAAAAAQQFMQAARSENEELQARAAGLEDDLRHVTEEAAERIADLELRVTAAARELREPALTIHAIANLLARDSGGRLDVTGRERLEQLRLSAEVIDHRVRDWIERCCAHPNVPASDSTIMGVVTGGDNGGAASEA